MAAISTRILWLLRDRGGLTYMQIYEALPAYRDITLGAALMHLRTHGLIGTGALDATSNAPRYLLTDLGRSIATNPTQPRWSARRLTPPRTATIAR